MYVPDDKVLGNPGLFGLVTTAVSTVAGALKKGTAEAHIVDRVQKYQSLPDAQLRDILALGGEAGEAARRVIASRSAGGAVSPSGGPLIDLSKLVKLPEVTTVSRLEAPAMPPWLIPGLIAGAAALFVLKRK